MRNPQPDQRSEISFRLVELYSSERDQRSEEIKTRLKSACHEKHDSPITDHDSTSGLHFRFSAFQRLLKAMILAG
jgi:hypothetical protein